MTETKPSDKQEQASQLEQEIVTAAAELIESGEVFSFPGLEVAYVEAAKQAELDYPGFSTPIVEIMERLEKDGMKVSKGIHVNANNPLNNVYIVPSGSNDNENDGTLLRHFQTNETMNEKLRKLILMAKEYKTLQG